MADSELSATAIFPTEIFRRIIYHVAVSRRRPRHRGLNGRTPASRRVRSRLQKLRLVSSEFNKLAADHLFGFLTITTSWPLRASERDILQALADGSTGLETSVRRIDIKLGNFPYVRSQDGLRESVLQEMRTLELIARALPRLSLLEEATINLDFNWRSGYVLTERAVITPRHRACIDSVLAGLPREPLRSLAITTNNTVFPSVLGGGSFTNLRTLTIRNPLEADTVSALIADNPHLSTLALSGHFIFSIGDMLPSIPPDTDCHRLKTLCMGDFTFLRDDVLVLAPFIKAVKQLVFTHISQIPDDLWAELHRLNAPLRTLFISDCQMYLSESFVDFISSCDSLKRLNFRSRRLYNENRVMTDPSPGIVHRFWMDTLPRLASSLRELEISGPENSGLCMQEVKYVNALSNCHLLQVLKVVVNADLAKAAHARAIIHHILTKLCQNSWPDMRDLLIDSCPVNRIPGTAFNGTMVREASSLLLHNTEFESSTEQIFKTRTSIFNEAHIFKCVDGVVRFVEERWAGHNTTGAAVNQGDGDGGSDNEAEESDGNRSFTHHDTDSEDGWSD